MPSRPSGGSRGRPESERIPNAHGVGCQCCGTFAAVAWTWLPPDDGAPMEFLRPYRWYCSGVYSGGTGACANTARRLGALLCCVGAGGQVLRQSGHLFAATTVDELRALGFIHIVGAPASANESVRRRFAVSLPHGGTAMMGVALQAHAAQLRANKSGRKAAAMIAQVCSSQVHPPSHPFLTLRFAMCAVQPARAY
jgi:hypothetical protein